MLFSLPPPPRIFKRIFPCLTYFLIPRPLTYNSRDISLRSGDSLKESLDVNQTCMKFSIIFYANLFFFQSSCSQNTSSISQVDPAIAIDYNSSNNLITVIFQNNPNRQISKEAKGGNLQIFFGN